MTYGLELLLITIPSLTQARHKRELAETFVLFINNAHVGRGQCTPVTDIGGIERVEIILTMYILS